MWFQLNLSLPLIPPSFFLAPCLFSFFPVNYKKTKNNFVLVGAEFQPLSPRHCKTAEIFVEHFPHITTAFCFVSITFWKGGLRINKYLIMGWGFPGGSDSKESTCNYLQCGRPSFDPWVRKIPWRREYLSTLVLLSGEIHWQRNLMGYSPWGCKESAMTEWLTFSSLLWAELCPPNSYV